MLAGNELIDVREKLEVNLLENCECDISVYNDQTEIVRDVMNQTRKDLNCHKSPDGFFQIPEDI